ncbi:MAG TPA: UDP-N-acetylmuramate--L-alanine ligase, partial [Candidatus Jacksonbacteria bacterium]|nr:UDP-N-acetylmuramate--L-alanine ligase [Candidatus Jacksonbacteria bacterium]HCR14979.1 UDP-N-acetylmuramate--L-alanine ligase [Candidatus Jacksonbacteria bacterium]
MEHFFSKSERILFIGIGGIGISAIAKLALSQGATVFGVDLASSSITRDLETSGAIIKIGRQATFDLKKQGISLIVQTTAAPATHPLIKNGKKLNIPILTYPQILGEISKKFITIAVSGMHGKSTTTAMIGILSVEAGLDPLVIVGTKVREWGGNIRLPLNSRFNKNQPLFIVEADEYKSAMLNL